MKYPSCDVYCARHIEDTFKRVVAAESVAAVIVEPILGEGGFVTPPAEFYPTLERDLPQIRHSADRRRSADWIRAHRRDVCLRTAGTRTRSGHDGQVSDWRLAHGRGYGTRRNHGCAWRRPTGRHIWGQSSACEAALAVLEIIEKENLCARANVLGERFRKRALKWQAQWELVGDVRGLGAMQALELVRSKATRACGRRDQTSVTILLRAWPGDDHCWILRQRDSPADAAGHYRRADG